MIFNRTRPLIGCSISCEQNSDWMFLGDSLPVGSGLSARRSTDRADHLDPELKQVVCVKYADYNYAMDVCHSDLVRLILRSAPIEGNHKNILVDIKVHDLKKDEFACLPGWHLDGSNNPKGFEKKSELHHLFVASRFALTEFLDTPLDVPIDPNWTFAERSQKLGMLLNEMELPIFTIPNCRYVTYDDSFFHRGKQATGDELRLLVRVTETDIIEPQNRVYTPYTHTKIHKDNVGLLEAKYHI